MKLALALVVATTAAAHAGPPSPVANVQIEIPNEPDRLPVEEPSAPPEPELTADHVRVHVWTQFASGFYPSPALEIVLRDAKSDVSRTPAPPAKDTHRALELAIPHAGEFAVDVLQAGKLVASVPLSAVDHHCAGGGRPALFQTFRTRESSSAPMPGMITAKLPALSLDGKTLAFAQEVYGMFRGQCAPPSGLTIDFASVPGAPAGAETAGAIDVSNLELLRCDTTRTPSGLTIVHPDDDLLHAQLKDSKGKILADVKADGGNGATTCISEKRRLLLVLMHWGRGGDCSSAGSYQPFMAKY